MTIKVGDRMPEGSFGIMTKDGPGSLSTADLFKGKTVVLFAVPGAFTPTCSMNHLPGYVKQAAEIRAKGRGHHRLHGGKRCLRHGCLGT